MKFDINLVESKDVLTIDPYKPLVPPLRLLGTVLGDASQIIIVIPIEETPHSAT